MKYFAFALLLVTVVVAEPPRYRPARFRSERQELIPPAADKEQTTPKSEEAPYPAAGFRPSKEFRLPSRQEVSPPATSYGVPADSYGVPLHIYSAPQTEYGVPKSKTSEPNDDNKEKDDFESFKVEGLKKGEKKEKLQEEPKNDAEVVSSQGAYYVLLPDSQLQRVQFETQNDIRNMAYTARLQYKNEERAPIYVYSEVPQYQAAAYVQLF